MAAHQRLQALEKLGFLCFLLLASEWLLRRRSKAIAEAQMSPLPQLASCRRSGSALGLGYPLLEFLFPVEGRGHQAFGQVSAEGGVGRPELVATPEKNLPPAHPPGGKQTPTKKPMRERPNHPVPGIEDAVLGQGQPNGDVGHFCEQDFLQQGPEDVMGLAEYVAPGGKRASG